MCAYMDLAYGAGGVGVHLLCGCVGELRRGGEGRVDVVGHV